MRVLIVITRGEPGGAQVHVRDLVRGLRDRVGFEVAVGDDEFLAQELRALGVPVHVVPTLQRSVSPVADARGFRDLVRLVRRVAPDLVHTHSTKAGLLGRAAAAMVGIPAVHTAHAWSFSEGLPASRVAFAVPVEALAGRVTRRFLVVSQADGELAKRYFVARAAQLRVVHNGVPDVPDRATPGAGAPPIVTMVARMAAPKDHVLLLRALARVDEPFRLRLVGDGPERPAVEAAARGLPVEFLGVRRDIPAILADTQIATLVSRQEGFPLVVLEAMRAGLPVVASDVGGIREAIDDGVTGFLVPRGEEDRLVGAFQRLLRDPALRRSMGEAGRRRYEGRFTVEQMLTATETVYREVLA